MPEEARREAVPSSSGRKLLVAVDDSAECERALAWALGELYRRGTYTLASRAGLICCLKCGHAAV